MGGIMPKSTVLYQYPQKIEHLAVEAACVSHSDNMSLAVEGRLGKRGKFLPMPTHQHNGAGLAEVLVRGVDIGDKLVDGGARLNRELVYLPGLFRLVRVPSGADSMNQDPA
jgi:hypothetical protein